MDSRNVFDQLDDVLRELEEILKRPEASSAFADRGVNTSIALVAAQGLSAYLRGDKVQAAEDLATAAEEVRARLEAARERNGRSN